jgi:hypothetical protein
MIRANFSAYGTYVTDSLYQWDINRTLIVNGLNLEQAPEIHFYNANMERAIVRQSTLDNGVATVTIPNALLQEALTIKADVCIYEDDVRKTIENIEIPVKAKARPLDYVFEDDGGDIYSYNALMVKIDEARARYAEVIDELGRVIDDYPYLPEFFHGISSYLAFVASQDTDTIDASFGKNNEDRMRGVGLALAMYGWFKGLNKTKYPFTNLIKMSTLNDMSFDVYKEIISNETLIEFVSNSEYATDKMLSKISTSADMNNNENTDQEFIINFEVTKEDLTVPFYFEFSSSTTDANSNRATVYINDVLAQDHYKQEDGKTKSASGIEEWSKYNITSAGTYSIKIVLSLSSLNYHNINSNFVIFKPKKY